MTDYYQYGVVIPAFNAEKSLMDVIKGVCRFIPGENVVVIDDGSQDNTSVVARGEGVIVLRHSKNLGKGSALKTGFNYLLRLSHIVAIFTIDSDGQHDPAEIPSFIKTFESTGADIVIGNRMNEIRNMPAIRKFTNLLTSAIISRIAGCEIKDSQSGYRLISRRVLEKIELVTERYDTESEILIKAGKTGARIESVPIKTIYADEISSINPFRDTIRFLSLVIRSFFW